MAYEGPQVLECSPVWRKLILCCNVAQGNINTINDLGVYLTDAQRDSLIPVLNAFEIDIEKALKPIIGYPPPKK